jgi:hypothetical protein
MELAQTCVIQMQGASYPTAMYGATSVPDSAVPNGATWAIFVPYNGDLQLNHYRIINGQCWYVPSDGSPLFLPPDVISAANAIQGDANIPAIVQAELAQFFGVLATYPVNTASVKQEWQNVVNSFGPTGTEPQAWLTAPIIALVEQHCTDNGCPLV